MRTIREHGLLGQGDSVLVAISGGPDSTALLLGLLKLAPRLGVTVAAACVDHGLRPEAAEEARGVALRCKAWGVPCEVLTVDARKAKRSHVSTQTAAREVRLSALEGAADRLGFTAIALGHTADDQVETVLFRILRGTGIAGLAGIPYRRGHFIRPLLDVRRREILAFLAKRRISFVSDPSNQDRRYARARIRHDLLPTLARENPRIAEALLALSNDTRRRGGLDDSESASSWRACLPPQAHVPDRAARVVERLLREKHGTSQVAVKPGVLDIRYGRVTWRANSSDDKPLDDIAAKTLIPIPAPGCFRVFPAPAPAIELSPFARSAFPRGRVASFDPKKLDWPLCLRSIRPGDRMRPRAGQGSRKLSDLLIDGKIPRAERATLPALCDGSGEILFVPGLRPSQLGCPDETSREWFEVRVVR